MKKIVISGISLLLLSGCVENNSREKNFPLTWAVYKGDIDTFHDLIAKGADVNEETEEGITPLISAVANGYIKIAEELILKGADVNKTDKENLITAVFEAAMRGDDEILELLLRHGADINKATPIVLASAKGNYYAVYTLIKHGANVNPDINQLGKDKYGETKSSPLMAALFNRHEKVAKLLIENGADVNKYCNDGSGDPVCPLSAAAWHGFYDIVKLLIEKGAKIDATDKEGATALYGAICQGHTEIAKLLIKHGVDINKNASLVIAAAEGNYYAVNTLIALGADIDQLDKEEGTPLMGALFNDHKKIAKLLIEKGANVNKCGKDGSGKSID